MNRSTPDLPVHHQLPESTQTHVHWVGDAIQPSHPLLSPFPPALNLSQLPNNVVVSGEDMGFEPTPLDIRSPFIAPIFCFPTFKWNISCAYKESGSENNTCYGSGINASKLVSPSDWFLFKHQDFLGYLHGFFLFPLLEFSCSDFFFPSLQKFSRYNSGEEWCEIISYAVPA